MCFWFPCAYVSLLIISKISTSKRGQSHTNTHPFLFLFVLTSHWFTYIFSYTCAYCTSANQVLEKKTAFLRFLNPGSHTIFLCLSYPYADVKQQQQQQQKKKKKKNHKPLPKQLRMPLKRMGGSLLQRSDFTEFHFKKFFKLKL